MEARHVMTTPVITVAPDANVLDIARTLSEKGISAVPVTDAGGRILGIVSEGDLMRRPEIGTQPRRSWWLDLIRDSSQRVDEFIKTHGLKASDIMTRTVVTVSPSTPIGEIAALLEKRRIKRVPVVENGKIVGIVSRANIVRALASQKAQASATAQTDGELRDSLMNLIAREGLASGASVNPIVEDGVIHLWGSVETQELREAIRIAAESIAGARRVENHVVVQPSPMYAS